VPHTAPAVGLVGSGHLTARWVPVSSCRLRKKLSPNRFTKMCSFWYGNIKHRQNTRWKGVVAGGGVQAGPTLGTFHWGQQVTWLPPTHYPNILQQTTVHGFDFGNKPRQMFNAFQRFVPTTSGWMRRLELLETLHRHKMQCLQKRWETKPRFDALRAEVATTLGPNYKH
jgi:hypothetical protein